MKRLEEEYVKYVEKELEDIEQTMLSEISKLDCTDCSADQIKLNASTQVVLVLQRAAERGVNKATIDNLSYQYEW